MSSPGFTGLATKIVAADIEEVGYEEISRIRCSTSHQTSHGFTREGGLLNSVATYSPTVTTSTLPPALQRACLAAKTAADNKGQDIVVLDLRKLTPIFDYFVISTGASRRQVHSIVEDTDEVLRNVGDQRLAVEGYETSRWVVQDYGDVIVHVFDETTRNYYNLEELWADGAKIDWEQEID